MCESIASAKWNEAFFVRNFFTFSVTKLFFVNAKSVMSRTWHSDSAQKEPLRYFMDIWKLQYLSVTCIGHYLLRCGSDVSNCIYEFRSMIRGSFH
jgi:hypothetical protein